MQAYRQKLTKRTHYLIIAAMVLGLMAPIFLEMRPAHALPALAKAYIRFDHLTATTVTSARVCVNPTTTVPNSGFVVINFPTTTGGTDWALDSTAGAGHWTTNTTFESGSGVSAMNILNSRASSVSGHTVTFTLTAAGSMTNGTVYCFNITTANNAITTPSVGVTTTVFGYIKTQNTTPTDLDQTYWDATMVTGDTVTVSATVAPFFTMSLSGTTDTFASNLSSASVNTSNGARYVQVDTNAKSGWILWVKDANFKTTGITETGTSPANEHGALTSVMAGSYAISNNTNNALATPNASHAFSGGSEDYGLAVTINQQGTGAGTASLNSVYDGSTAGNAGVLDPTQYRPIGSSTGTAIAARLNIKMLVTISNSTPPGNDYTDTLEYVGAGQF